MSDQDVWYWLDIAYERAPDTRDRIDQTKALEEPERTQQANDLLTVLWASLAEE